jgi:hypothetical protein
MTVRNTMSDRPDKGFEVKLWEVEPANQLLSDHADNEAYLTARPGSSYALYFPDGGSVGLDRRRARRIALYVPRTAAEEARTVAGA